MILEGLNPAVRDNHDQVRAPVFIPPSTPSFEQLDELTQQLTPLLATLDALTLTYTQQVTRPVFDCRRVMQVENDGTQAMLASLDNLMPGAPQGLHYPDLRTTNDCTYVQWLAHSAHYQREATALAALLDGMSVPPAYCHVETWAAQTNNSLLVRGCQTIAALRIWMSLLPASALPSGAGTSLLPAAAVSGMVTTQDVLHLLWEMEQKALHLWLPGRHKPIPGYVLTQQGSPITDAQRNDRGLWSEALLTDTRELEEGVHSINRVRLPSEIREDVDVLCYVAQLQCAGINVDWAVWYGTPLPQHGSASAYPFAHNRYPLPGWVMGSVEAQPGAEPETHHPYQTHPVLSVPFVAAYSRGMQYITGLMELLLEISPIGVDDDFFELDGHSLLVTQLISRLEHDFNVYIDLLTLMESPDLRSIYMHIATQLGGGDSLEITCQ